MVDVDGSCLMPQICAITAELPTEDGGSETRCIREAPNMPLITRFETLPEPGAAAALAALASLAALRRRRQRQVPGPFDAAPRRR